MHNGIFGKLLYSEIWEENTATRCVLIALLACADKSGHADIDSIRSVARIAAVSFDEAKTAISFLESRGHVVPIDGGWLVRSGEQYSILAWTAHWTEKNRLAVARHRANKTLVVSGLGK